MGCALLAFVTVSPSGCGDVAAGSQPRPPIVLVALDSIPARSTGLGAGPSATPVLDRLAEDVLAFDACLAPEPWSAPSLAATLHGVPVELETEDPGRPPSIVEEARRLGYRTQAVVADDCVGTYTDESPLFAGFDGVERLGAGVEGGALAHDVVAEGLRFLTESDG